MTSRTQTHKKREGADPPSQGKESGATGPDQKPRGATAPPRPKDAPLPYPGEDGSKPRFFTPEDARPRDADHYQGPSAVPTPGATTNPPAEETNDHGAGPSPSKRPVKGARPPRLEI